MIGKQQLFCAHHLLLNGEKESLKLNVTDYRILGTNGLNRKYTDKYL